MKILVENSGYHLNNMGDLAMLKVAIERLSQIWPDASFEVFTTAPDKLVSLFPEVKPLSPSGRAIWLSPFIKSAYNSSITIWFSRKLSYLEWSLRKNLPSFFRILLQFKLRNNLEGTKELNRFIEAVYKADLIVATGGGYITDAFKHHAIAAFSTLELASKLGKPVAMLGQGLGPIHEQDLLDKGKQVLPVINLIAVREKKVGIPLLQSINVSGKHVVVTGDDAIELAYNVRKSKIGNGIGVNLRVAQYSGINSEVFETVRLSLHSIAHELKTTLLPTPIDHLYYEGYCESDSMSIQKLLSGYDDTSDGGATLDTPIKVIEQISQCRVVVTGSYHAGVFALSQGIPVVGLAKSEYYANKFLGLADQFGVGCTVIFLDDPSLKEKLIESIKDAWSLAEKLRPQLLDAAKQQIDLGHAAYKRVYELVNLRQRHP
jgi:polysaccharide pyruvyl transferase WcaK-like protein